MAKISKNVKEISAPYAENVVCLSKYELTYIPIEWTCPFCKTENNTTLILEEDLNYKEDNYDTCRNAKRKLH